MKERRKKNSPVAVAFSRASSKRHRGDTPAARKILDALYELENTLADGVRPESKYPSRHIAPPGEYDGAKVRMLRKRLQLTQEMFARLLGASTVLVQKWEANTRHPDGMARRLMDAVHEDPRRWLAKIDEASPHGLPRSHKLPERARAVNIAG